MLPGLLLVPLVVAEPRPFYMNDLSASSTAGAEVMWGHMDAQLVFIGDRDIDAFMVHAVGDFAVTPEVKLSLRFPFTYVSCDCFGNNLFDLDDDQFALGNLTVGGRYVHRVGDVAIGAGASYSGLTASDDTADEGRAAILTGLWALFRDAGWYLPNTHTLRFTGDARVALGRAYLQGQLAVHELIVEDDDDFTTGENYTLMRLVAGGGFKVTEAAALQAELVTTSLILDDDDDDNLLFDDDEWFHVLDLGARYETAGASFGVRLSIPLDYGGSDFIDDPIGIGVDALARF
jgi:hypothetical protein